MPKATVEPRISTAHIAQHPGVHLESLRRWAKGNGMSAAKIGMVWRFKVSEVERWAKVGGCAASPKLNRDRSAR